MNNLIHPFAKAMFSAGVVIVPPAQMQQQGCKTMSAMTGHSPNYPQKRCHNRNASQHSQQQQLLQIQPDCCDPVAPSDASPMRAVHMLPHQ
jgi:hypothetical protein